MVCNSSFSPSELLSTDEIWSNHSSSIYCSNVHSNFQYAGGEALQGQHRANNQYSLQVKFEMLGRDSIWSWFLSSNDGQSIITSSADDQIIIYDCEKGTQKRVLNSKKYWKSSILFMQSITSASNRYGVDLIHFTQNKGHAVHASTKENDIIRSEKNTLFPNGDNKTSGSIVRLKWGIPVFRYMSLTENKYIRYFGGHDKRVVTMAMNPADETFLSGRLSVMRCDDIIEEDSDYLNHLFPV